MRMAMEVFVGNLPLETTAHDLRGLVGYTEQPVYFRIVRKRARSGEIICYGVASAPSEEMGRRLIERLSRMELGGRRLVAREYVRRNYGNERRAVDWRSRPWHGPERRRGERRAT